MVGLQYAPAAEGLRAAAPAAAVVAQRVARPCQAPSIQFQMLQHLPMPPLPAAARPPGSSAVASLGVNSLVFGECLRG